MSNLRERNIAMVIILSLVTCGIYNIYLYFALATEIKNEGIKYGENLTSPIVAVLLSIVTCGIYALFYIHKQAVILKKIGDTENVQVPDPIIPLICTVFLGIGIWINANSASNIAARG